MITKKRKPNGLLYLYAEGKEIGYIVSFKADRDFGLYLNGVYWKSSSGFPEPNSKGGSVGHIFKRQWEAVEMAESLWEKAEAISLKLL
jgi:hypothetical protein